MQLKTCERARTSVLWAAAASGVLIAAFCRRVLILAHFKIGVVPEWLGPALFVAIVAVAGIVLFTVSL